MNSKRLLPIVAMLVWLLTGCSDPEREQELVDLFATAAQDIAELRFAAEFETVVSASSEVTLQVEGVKTNGDIITLAGDSVDWRLIGDGNSRVNRQGVLSAADNAETVTLEARLGVLSETVDIRVSTAVFDQVVALNGTPFTIDMCRSQALHPVGRYVDTDDVEEIRRVDSTIIESIEWTVRNAEDDSVSQRAYIETTAGQPSLHTLASGDLQVFAEAFSTYQQQQVVSTGFDQSVANNMLSIRLCPADSQDLENCGTTSTAVEQDQSINLIAVGTYQVADADDLSANITRTAKWGTSNSTVASLLLSADKSQLQVTGDREENVTSLSVACGAIEESLAGIEVSEGVILESAVSCGVDADCQQTTATLSIERLTVDALQVSIDDTELSDGITVFLATQPSELELSVSADYVNDSSRTITEDPELIYEILSVANQATIIEEKSDSPGVFTVLGAGTARIQLEYRDVVFEAVVEIPF